MPRLRDAPAAREGEPAMLPLVEDSSRGPRMPFLIETALFVIPVLGVVWLLTRRRGRDAPGSPPLVAPHVTDPVVAAVVLLVVQPLLFWWMARGSGDGVGAPGWLAGAALVGSYLVAGGLACLIPLGGGWSGARSMTLWLPRRPVSREILLGLGIGLGLTVADVAFVPVLDALQLPERFGHQPAIQEQMADAPGMLPGLVLTAVLLAPIVEEFLFRGLALAAFEPRLGTPAAIWLSALLFALLHGEAYVPILVKGLVFAWIYARQRSLFIPVLAHAANNGQAVLLLLLAPS